MSSDLAVIAATLAAAAPPLTSEQADRIAALLRGDK